MQTQADLLQAPVVRPSHQETTAMGAAFAAGLGAGIWDEAFVFHKDPAEADATTFQPELDPSELAPRLAKWKDAVQRSFGLA
eukprot:scaffold470628_cov45-Prasinocladus_malaysianus.AAC.1